MKKLKLSLLSTILKTNNSYLDEDKRQEIKKLRQYINQNSIVFKELKEEEKFLLSLSILEKPFKFRLKSEVNILAKLTRDIKFFKEIRSALNGKQIHKECCQYFEYQYYLKDQVIFVEGSYGDTFWIILNGEVQISKTKHNKTQDPEKMVEYQQVLVTLQTGNCFGELALMNDGRRQATVTCTKDSHFVILHKQEFVRIMEHGTKRGLLHSFMEYFSSMIIFQNWNYQKTKMIYDISSEENYSMNNYVFKEKDEDKYIYLIKDGVVELRKFIEIIDRIPFLNNKQSCNNQIEVKLFTLSKGSSLGEEDLLKQEKKGNLYSVVCVSEKVSFYKIDLKQFFSKIQFDSKILALLQSHINTKNQLIQQKIQEQEQIYQQNNLIKNIFTKREPDEGLIKIKRKQQIVIQEDDKKIFEQDIQKIQRRKLYQKQQKLYIFDATKINQKKLQKTSMQEKEIFKLAKQLNLRHSYNEICSPKSFMTNTNRIQFDQLQKPSTSKSLQHLFTNLYINQKVQQQKKISQLLSQHDFTQRTTTQPDLITFVNNSNKSISINQLRISDSRHTQTSLEKDSRLNITKNNLKMIINRQQLHTEESDRSDMQKKRQINLKLQNFLNMKQ